MVATSATYFQLQKACQKSMGDVTHTLSILLLLAVVSKHLLVIQSQYFLYQFQIKSLLVFQQTQSLYFLTQLLFWNICRNVEYFFFFINISWIFCALLKNLSSLLTDTVIHVTSHGCNITPHLITAALYAVRKGAYGPQAFDSTTMPHHKHGSYH